MGVSSFIARRYFFGRKRMFASFLSAVAVLGVTLGVFSLVVVMSVMLGFSNDLQKKLIGFNAHVVVEGDAKVDSPLIENKASIIEGEGIIEVVGTNGEVSQGVKIRGMDDADLPKLKDVSFFYGVNSDTNAPLDFARGRLKNLSTVIIGNELAAQLGVHPDYNDKIDLIVPIGKVGPTGELIPSRKGFDVTGMFKSGYFENDSKTVIISKEDARRLLGDRGIVALHIWLKDIGNAASFANELRASDPELNVYTWQEGNKKLFAALKLERIAMSVLLLLIIAIATIAIISVVFMYVYLRRKDIAILASIGAPPGEIRAIFIRIGAIIGTIGTSLGLILGVTLVIYIKRHNLPLPDSYYLDHLPVIISWPFLTSVAVAGVLLSIIAAYYPSSEAVKLKPQELLRYE
ncbi:MAG: hypothetical protein COV46_01475 [Deltaproteobacteria bacterium CG11_big_fil_rev_8_21_14_0_20_49_13]|nr:MAG: hypothetical protein COV46_01475 [Deltaproteobacteria bacterium CG11_big_fil_rev_8_21_14_0_20_49_13]